MGSKSRLSCGRLSSEKYKWTADCMKPGFNRWKVDYLSQERYQKWSAVCVRVRVCVKLCVAAVHHVKLVNVG